MWYAEAVRWAAGSGVVYRATADGNVTVMSPEDGVAFGTVAKFDTTVPVEKPENISSIEVLKEKLAPYVEKNPNIFYMLKATGTFGKMHIRSCYACEKPYPTLSEAASHQK